MINDNRIITGRNGEIREIADNYDNANQKNSAYYVLHFTNNCYNINKAVTHS